MQFAFMGINYTNAALDIRDKTAFTESKKIEFWQQAQKIGVDQCMILATCNRSEICFFYTQEMQRKQMKNLYCNMFLEVNVEEYLLELTGDEAFYYLFRVSAGLESLVLGEDQILGQVKDALDTARTLGYSKKEMNKVVRDGITCAKKIKTKFKISEQPLSVGYIGIKQLDQISGIDYKKILIIGSGKTATLALRYVREYDVKKLWVSNRTLERARQLREEFPDVEVIHFDERYEVMKQCDIVISATASPHLIIKREDFVPSHKMTFLDLATPRDIDVAFSKEKMVHLINLDDLQKIAKENQRQRERLVEESKEMIQSAVMDTKEWLFHSRMDETIGSLQQRCDDIVGDSYEYLSHKLNLNDREDQIVKKVLKASLLRLLREPIKELKHLDSEEKQDAYKEVLQHLFQI